MDRRPGGGAQEERTRSAAVNARFLAEHAEAFFLVDAIACDSCCSGEIDPFDADFPWETA